jgi:hypothetical protein
MDTQITLDEAIDLGAKDGLFFCYFFFPESFTLPPPQWQTQFWNDFDDPQTRYICYEVFRDGGKTTTFRAAYARQIAYGLTRTGLFLSESRSHSRRSLDWIRNKVLYNKRFATAFGLQIGNTDNADELEIINTALGIKTTLIAQGIEGQIRGINQDDARPDFILCDDISSYESYQTPEAQDRIAEIFFGAVLNSLAAASINPHAKLINIGTRAGAKDVIARCKLDSQFLCKSYSVFSPEGTSTWPEKWPTSVLLKDKTSAEQRGQLSTWLREKESKFVIGDQTAFKPEHLNFYTHIPDDAVYFIGVDPVPPPSAREIAAGLRNKDWEVFSVIAYHGRSLFLEEQIANKGHEIDWSLTTFFSLLQRYRPLAVGVDANGYQRTLARAFQREMDSRRIYRTQIVEISDRLSKFHRITQALLPFATSNNLFVKAAHTNFIEQFTEYPGCAHDDHLESVALAVLAQQEAYPFLQYGQNIDKIYEELAEEEEHMPALIPPPGYGAP